MKNRTQQNINAYYNKRTLLLAYPDLNNTKTFRVLKPVTT